MKLDQLVNAEHCGVFASNTIGRKKKKKKPFHIKGETENTQVLQNMFQLT